MINYHAGGLFYGTAADRAGLDTTLFRVGISFLESDTGYLYWWNGTTWISWIGAGAAWALRTEVADYVITAADTIIIVDATGGDIDITLPAATGLEGKIYVIKRIDGSVNTVTVAGAETIDDEVDQTLDQYDAMMIVSDDTEWWII